MMSVGLPKDLVVEIGLTVVPPTSMTSAASFGRSPACRLARKLAPRIELVGPLEKVLMGNCAAWSQLIRVPSFDVSHNGHERLSDDVDFWNPETVCSANRRKEALRIAAFSRWRSPVFVRDYEYLG